MTVVAFPNPEERAQRLVRAEAARVRAAEAAKKAAQRRPTLAEIMGDGPGWDGAA